MEMFLFHTHTHALKHTYTYAHTDTYPTKMVRISTENYKDN